LPVALWLVRQVCQALDVLQQSGWTHGDVKPANVMIAENGHATLIDFAFAHRGTLIAGSPFEGTPDFAAPEVVVNPAARTPASDVFAAGRMLWEWLTRVETQDEAVLAPVCELVESMVAEDASHRPSAGAVVKELLRLEIDTLGEHIIPSAPQPIASRAA
ncbi:MAG: protein kinase family protein, partial [Planctomycetota bacterium]